MGCPAASFLASKFSHMPKYTTPALPYVPKLSSDAAASSDAIDMSYREIYDAAISYDRESYEVTEIVLPVPECSPLWAPEECTPENFRRLMDEGKIEELKRLEERCYVRAEYVNRLLDCYVRLVEFLRQLDEAIRG